MENINQKIYTLPEIRRTLLPLWSAWALVAVGAVCGAFYFLSDNLSAGGSSALMGGLIVGGCSLLVVLCYYAFGDSRRPYHRGLHAVLEPTWAYYAPAQQQQVTAALEAHDEQALEAVKRSPKPELALVRYSDREERIYYSQLLRADGKRWQPLTDIIVNKVNH